MSNLDKYTVEELDRENKELKTKVEALESIVNGSALLNPKVITSYRPEVSIHLRQWLADIKADDIEELIKEKAYSASIDGIATSIIDADGAIQYADKFRGKS